MKSAGSDARDDDAEERLDAGNRRQDFGEHLPRYPEPSGM
jgi:hypothetical protein